MTSFNLDSSQTQEIILNTLQQYQDSHPTSQGSFEPVEISRKSEDICLISEYFVSQGVTTILAKTVISLLGATFVAGATVALSAREVLITGGEENEKIVIVATESLRISCKTLVLENVCFIITKDTSLDIEAELISKVKSFEILEAVDLVTHISIINKHTVQKPFSAELTFTPFEFVTSGLREFKSFVKETLSRTAGFNPIAITYANTFIEIKDKIANLAKKKRLAEFHIPFTAAPKSDQKLYETIKPIYLLILEISPPEFALRDLLSHRIKILEHPPSHIEVKKLLAEIREEFPLQQLDPGDSILDMIDNFYPEKKTSRTVANVSKELVVYYFKEDQNKVYKAKFFKLFLKACGNSNCKRYQTNVFKLKACGRCRQVSYCDETCQKADWASHKILCLEST